MCECLVLLWGDEHGRPGGGNERVRVRVHAFGALPRPLCEGHLRRFRRTQGREGKEILVTTPLNS